MSENNKPELEYDGLYTDGVRKLVKCCVHLRCKTMYYSGVERPGLLHESDVMTYYCNHTQQVFGADGQASHLYDCQPGRKCCEM